MTVDRRPMGAGSIEERDGRFRVRLRIGGVRETLGTYPTRAEAEGVLSAAIAKLEAQRAAAIGATTLRDWIPRWQKQRVHEVRSTESDGSRLTTHVLSEPWADDPIETVSRARVQAWVRELLSRPARRYVGGAKQHDAPKLAELDRSLSRTSVGHALRSLRVCFRDALEAGLVDSNPCVDVRVPRVEHADEPWTFMTVDELAVLFRADAVPVADRQIYFVAIFTGLRKGELWGLRWGDVDFAANRLTVRRSYAHAPKSGKHRHVPLLAPARAALEALANSAPADPEALVFPSASGRMRRPYDSAGFAAALRAAGIARAVRFHDLRHTCASHLLMGTWERAPRRLEDVQAWLGHSDVKMTQRYSHLAADYLRANDSGPTLAPNWSHLRELNPRPTVYEIHGAVNGSASLAPNGATVGPDLEALAIEVLLAARENRAPSRAAVEAAIQLVAIASTPAKERVG